MRLTYNANFCEVHVVIYNVYLTLKIMHCPPINEKKNILEAKQIELEK